MAEVAAPTEPVAVATVPPAPKDWRETWQRATAKAEAFEKAEAAKLADASAEADKAAAAEDTAEADDHADTDEPDTADASAEGDSDDADDGEAKADGKGKAEAKSAPDKAKRAELEKLAKELGLKIDDRGVTPKDRAEFRAEKRKWHESQKQRESAFTEQVRAAWSVLEPLAKAKEAAEKGDVDGALKAIFGKDFGELTESEVEKLRDPTQREMRALKKQIQERDEREAKARADAEAQERAAAQERERQRYMAELAHGLTKSEDEAISRAAANGRVGKHFAYLVMSEQESAFDGHDTISAEDAAELARDKLRADYEALQEIFGDRDASNPESHADGSAGVGRGNGTPAKAGGKKPPTTLPKRRAAEASAPGRQLSESEWTKKWAAQLRQSNSA